MLPMRTDTEYARNENQLALARKKKQAQSFYRIAIGKQDEMECTKSTVSILRGFYRPGMTIADIGCGACHYLRSFYERLDRGIKYFGIDREGYHIEMARQAFKDVPLIYGNINQLPIADNCFDIVLCSNVVTALAPPPDEALSELIRISRKWVVIRLAMGAANYIVKIFPEKKPDRMNAIDFFKDETMSTYRNIYSQAYISDMIKKAAPNSKFTITPDSQFGNFNEDNPDPTATRVVNGMQIAGNLVIDQRFVVIKKE